MPVFILPSESFKKRKSKSTLPEIPDVPRKKGPTRRKPTKEEYDKQRLPREVPIGIDEVNKAEGGKVSSSSKVQAKKPKSKKKNTKSKTPPIKETLKSIQRLEEQMEGEELLRGNKKYMSGGKVSSSSKYKCSHNSLY